MKPDLLSSTKAERIEYLEQIREAEHLAKAAVEQFKEPIDHWSYNEWISDELSAFNLPMHLVYKLTNICGYFYIGKHSYYGKAEQFLSEKHTYWGSGYNMVSARRILKDAWTREIVFVANNNSLCHKLEAAVIATYEGDNFCLNIVQDQQALVDKLCLIRVKERGLL